MVMGTEKFIREVSAFQPSQKHQKELQEFFAETSKGSVNIIKEILPSKILFLNSLLKEKNQYKSFFDDILEKSGGKKVKLDLATSKSSPLYDLACSEYELLKAEVLELVELTSTVKLWLQMNIPRIEDGNNFGVSIQTDTVGELSRVEDSALMTIESWSKFLMMRSKVIGKMYKHPEIKEVGESYGQLLEAMDEKQLRAVWIGWIDLRNHYSVIYDMLVKNMEKLLNPRSSNTEAMY